MQAISSVEELLEILPECSGNEFVEISHGMELQPEDFEEYAYWSKDHYTRNCVSRSEEYELILLCWEPGQDTPVHCHNNEECWVYNLQGSVIEKRFDFRQGSKTEIEETQEAVMNEGEVSYMHDTMGFHSLHNTGEVRAMTLHLYIKPIDSCRVYVNEEIGFKRKELEYDTYEGKPV